MKNKALRTILFIVMFIFIIPQRSLLAITDSEQNDVLKRDDYNQDYRGYPTEIECINITRNDVRIEEVSYYQYFNIEASFSYGDLELDWYTDKGCYIECHISNNGRVFVYKSEPIDDYRRGCVTVLVDDNYSSGIIAIDSVMLKDKSGKTLLSYTEEKPSVTVVEPDIKIKGIRYKSDRATRPGIVTAYIDVQSTSYGVNEVSVSLRNRIPEKNMTNEKTVTWKGKSVYTGTISVDIPISSDFSTGEWEIAINTVVDNRGVNSDFAANPIALEKTVTIVDEFDYAQRFSLSNPNIVTLIKKIPEGKAARIYIDDESEGIIPKGVFDAIKGKDITIVAYRDSYQWIINGKDVANTKDICVLISFSEVEANEYGTKEKAVRIQFKPNGKLPARSQIRIKSDYLYWLYGEKGKLYLYYNNNGVMELEKNSNMDLVFDGTDKWCYFSIDHNSEFVISGSKVKATSPVNETSVSGFIDRLYDKVLGRAADQGGKDYWKNQVMKEGKTGADIAKGFLYSPEFLNKEMSDGDFLEILYNVFFDRASDAGGKDYWLGKMAGGMSKQDVIMGFINSTEWANVCLSYGIPSGGNGVPNKTITPNEKVVAFATRLYTTCLGRNADQGGLDYWAGELANMRVTGTSAAHGFFFSTELLNKNISNDDYITRLYRTFMGREPDQGGFDYWMGRFAAGASREDVFQGFAQSREFGEICASYGILR